MTTEKLFLTRLMIFVLVLSNTLEINDSGDPYTKAINNRSYESYQQGRNQAVIDRCHDGLMRQYSIEPDATSLGDPNPLCPNIGENCCGVGSQEKIKKMWKNDRKRQESHHKTVMFIYKYILGFGKQYERIASEVVQNFNEKKDNNGKAQTIKSGNKAADNSDLSYVIDSTAFCAKAADRLTNSGFGEREKAEKFYEELSYKLEFLENSRAGFYCFLCSPKLLENTRNTWKFFRILYNRRIYYSMDYCKFIHTHTFQTTYSTWKTFQPYVKNILRMLSCVKVTKSGTSLGSEVTLFDPLSLLARNSDGKGGAAGNGSSAKVGGSTDYKKNSISTLLTPIAEKMFDNPLGLSGTFKFETCDVLNSQGFFFRFFCQSFCESYNLVKPTAIFDGDIKRMKMTYDHLVQYEGALANSRQTLFRNNIVRMKKELQANYNLRKKQNFKDFYTARDEEQSFNRYITDFETFGGGVNIMELASGTTLEFYYKNVHIVKTAVLFFLLAFLF